MEDRVICHVLWTSFSYTRGKGILINASLVLRLASFRDRVKNLVQEIEARASIWGSMVIGLLAIISQGLRGVYKKDNVVRGHHNIYKISWTPVTGEKTKDTATNMMNKPPSSPWRMATLLLATCHVPSPGYPGQSRHSSSCTSFLWLCLSTVHDFQLERSDVILASTLQLRNTTWLSIWVGEASKQPGVNLKPSLYYLIVSIYPGL